MLILPLLLAVLSTVKAQEWLCGVNGNKEVFCADTDIEKNPNWEKVDMGANIIDVSLFFGGALYGITDNDQIRMKTLPSGQSILFPVGSLKQISRHLNIVCGVNSGDQVYCADKNITTNPTWIQLPGSLKYVVVYEGQLWGTNSNDDIYYARDWRNPTWVQLGGKLTQLSVSDGVLCGVNANDDIFCSDSSITANPIWTQLDGKLQHIVTRNGRLFGTNSGGDIFYAPTYKDKSPAWVKLPGSLNMVDVFPKNWDANSQVNYKMCGVNGDGLIKCADNDLEHNPNWSPVLGWLKDISVYEEQAFGVNDNDQIFFNPGKGAPWVQLPGSLKQISYYNNVVCGVDSDNDIFCADDEITTKPNWKKLPGSATYVSVYENMVAAVNSDHEIFITKDYKNAKWISIEGRLDQVSLWGNVICGTSLDDIFCSEGDIFSNSKWNQIGGKLKQVQMVNGKLFGVNSDDNIFYAKNYKDVQNWVKLSGSLKQISYYEKPTGDYVIADRQQSNGNRRRDHRDRDGNNGLNFPTEPIEYCDVCGNVAIKVEDSTMVRSLATALQSCGGKFSNQANAFAMAHALAHAQSKGDAHANAVIQILVGNGGSNGGSVSASAKAVARSLGSSQIQNDPRSDSKVFARASARASSSSSSGSNSFNEPMSPELRSDGPFGGSMSSGEAMSSSSSAMASASASSSSSSSSSGAKSKKCKCKNKKNKRHNDDHSHEHDNHQRLM